MCYPTVTERDHYQQQGRAIRLKMGASAVLYEVHFMSIQEYRLCTWFWEYMVIYGTGALRIGIETLWSCYAYPCEGNDARV